MQTMALRVATGKVRCRAPSSGARTPRQGWWEAHARLASG